MFYKIHLTKKHELRTTRGETAPLVFLLKHGPKFCTFSGREAGDQAEVSFLSAVSESGVVDVLHKLRQRLREEGQVHAISDVILSPLEQVQQALQEGAQLWVTESERGRK